MAWHHPHVVRYWTQASECRQLCITLVTASDALVTSSFLLLLVMPLLLPAMHLLLAMLESMEPG